MKITISYFRSIISKTLELPEKGFVLLRGRSGSGKSTIFDAITWAIYGGNINVFPRLNRKCTPTVSIELPLISFSRTKKPETINVVFSNKTYTGDEANQILISYFGSKRIWFSTSYSIQGERHPLFNSDQTEKRALLTELSFANENPDYYLEKLSIEMNKCRTEYSTLFRIHNSNKMLFEQKYEKYIEILESHTIEELNVKLKDLESNYLIMKKEHETLKSQSILMKQEEAKLNQIKKQLDAILVKLSNIPENTIESINLLECERDKLVSLRNTVLLNKKQKKLIEQYQEYKLEYSEITCGNVKYKITDKIEYQNSMRDYEITLKTCKKIGVEPNLESIQNYINDAKYLLEKQSNVKLYRQIESLEKTKIKLDENTKNEGDLMKLKENLHHKKQCLNILVCPKCSQSLYHHGKQLIISENSPTSIDEIKKLENEIRNLEIYLEKKRKNELVDSKIQMCISELNNENGDVTELKLIPLLNVQQRESLNNEILMLNKLKCFSSPKVSLIEIENSIRKQELESKISELEKSMVNIEITNCETNEKELNFKIESITQDLRNKRVFYESRISHLKFRDTLKNSHDSIIVDTSIYERESMLKEKISECENEICDVKGLISAEQSLIELIDQSNELMRIQYRIECVEKITLITKSVATNTLNDIIESLNTSIESVASTFFSHPFSLDLILEKTVKSTKNVKPGVFINIGYNGSEIDSLNGLSGGEADRTSLLMTSVLATHCGSPVLFFDEILASVDADTKESCLTALRSVLPENKLVLFVVHDAITGYFDSVVDID